jgi:hypothetical protein
MREFLIKSIQYPNGKHKNTKEEYDKEIQGSKYEHFVKKLSRENVLEKYGKVCYVFGMGKQPKSTYRKINKEQGVTVVWYGSLFPKILKPLGLVIASYEGLVKILDRKKLPEVFFELSKMSMVGVYYFSEVLEKEFIETIKEKKYSVYVDLIVKKDPEYLIYQVDTDNMESSTGVYEIVSYGVKCPSEIVSLLTLGR